jgi:hypothetical protein
MTQCRCAYPDDTDPAAHIGCPIHATYTSAEVKVLTETATRLGRELGRREALDEPERDILALSRWVDSSPAYTGVSDESANWRRITKLVEEAGEAVNAYAGSLGENPRKGRTHSLHDVQRELYDVALASLGAIAHLRGNTDASGVLEGLHHHIESVAIRAGVTRPASGASSGGLTGSGVGTGDTEGEE